MQTIIPIVLIIAFLYLLLIRPQRQRQRHHQALLENLKPGDEVITAGGIYGDIVAVDDEKVHVLIAEDVEKIDPDLVARDTEGKPNVVRYESINGRTAAKAN